MIERNVSSPGNDLIQWLAARLKISEEEHMEAVRLAMLLCHYGYIFPVGDSRNLAVKEDASLYRFQVSWLVFNCSVTCIRAFCAKKVKSIVLNK